MKKNKNAVALGKKRWRGKSKKEKRDHAMKMVAGRQKTNEFAGKVDENAA